MKLELKHLAPYLPYGLKIRTEYYDKTVVMQGLEGHNIRVGLHYSEKGGNFDMLSMKDNDTKPILRPLSDCIKLIENNGHEFVPYQEMGKILYIAEQDNFDKEGDAMVWLLARSSEDFKDLPYTMFEKLFEWHFDVFGLIEKNLAIDINTLKL